jgi:hypothetical protein
MSEELETRKFKYNSITIEIESGVIKREISVTYLPSGSRITILLENTEEFIRHLKEAGFKEVK